MYILSEGKKEKPRHKLLNTDYIPTPLVQREQRQPIEVSRTYRHPSILRVVLHFIAYFFWRQIDRLLGRDDPLNRAIAARKLLQNLGGIWVKLGQLLSMRNDIFTEEMCDQLSKCLYANVAFPSSVVREVVERELGRPIDALFAVFEDNPIAAASIAQVHRGVLLNENVAVVIKVMRPGVSDAFRRDMALLRILVRFFSVLLPIAHLRLPDGLTELNEMVEEELNYTYEALNIKRLRRNLRKHNVYVPLLFSKYVSEKVLVLEEIQGVLMSEAIAISRQEPQRFKVWCNQNDVDPKKVASHLFYSNLRQLLEDNLFHADMHPGNIILLRHNRYALIDFGTVGTLDPSFLALYTGVLKSISSGNFVKAANLAIHMCTDIPTLDLEKLKRDLSAAMRLWQARTAMEGLTYHDRSLGASTQIIGKVFAKYRLQISWSSLRMARTWGTLDTTLAYFYPNMIQAKMLENYLKKAVVRRRKHLLANVRDRAVDLFDTAYQFRMLIDPIAHRNVIAYKQKLNKISLAVSALFQFLLVLSILIGLFSAHVFLDQNFEHLIDLSHLPSAGLIDDFPQIKREWFIVLMFLIIAVILLLRKLNRIVTTAYLR